MRRLVHVVAGAWLLLTPAVATAQSELPPVIVQNLSDPDAPQVYSPWIAAAAGATVMIVGVNAWTGGALLTPAIGTGLSAVLGGAWLGTAALPPLSAQSMFETSTLIASGIVGGGAGYWLWDE